jgi:hypothetical protein
MLKGRYDRVKRVKGERHWNTTLTEKDVLRLRREYAAKPLYLRIYAERYGTTPQTIHRIIKRQVWKHI